MGWVLGLVAVSLVVVLVVTVLGLRTATVDVSSEGLRIRDPFFGRVIPITDIETGAARVIDFATAPDLRLKWRTFGIGLSGHQSGWFSLQNGEKALVFLTAGDPILYIPTKQDYSLLISAPDPPALVSALKAAHP